MIRIENLVKRYGKSTDALVALDHISLTLPDTGLVFVLGKSGCGKSTLLNMLGGLDDITEGEIFYDGVAISKLGETELNNYRNNYIGIIYQNFNLFEKETVFDNVYLAGKKSEKALLDKKIDGLLADLTLSEKKNSLIKNLSGGQKQRVAIARALIKDSKVILADEPTGNLDSKNTKMIFDILKETAKDRLVVVVSHDVKSAEAYADRIISLSDGKVVDDVVRNATFEETDNAVLDLPADCSLTEKEIKGQYELETGNVIIETFKDRDPDAVPGVLVHSHGPFAWGTDAMNAVHNAVVMEEVAFMNWHAQMISPEKGPMQQALLDKHYLRKHGAGAYYGQNT